MTKEKQNIAIYKILGYEPRKRWRFWVDKQKSYGEMSILSKAEAVSRIKFCKCLWPYSEYPEEYEFSEPEEYDDWYDLPSIDLDLLHKAVETLSAEQIQAYHEELQDMFPFSMHSPTPAISAKLEDRRKALLKTLNLWED